jgi:vacuolar-type H+-ATPase subunit H
LKKAREHAEKLHEETEREATARAQELIASGEQERARLLAEAGEAKAFVDQTQEQLSDFLMAAARWQKMAKLPDDDGDAGEARSVSEERP